MPTMYTRTERRCDPCEYHKAIMAFYGADHSWRDYNCMHPQAFDDITPATSCDPAIAAKQSEIRARLKEYGRHIGKTELCPLWCPLSRISEGVNQ